MGGWAYRRIGVWAYGRIGGSADRRIGGSAYGEARAPKAWFRIAPGEALGIGSPSGHALKARLNLTLIPDTPLSSAST